MQQPDEMNLADLPAADRELESALGGIAPAAPRQSRDAWLFKAGAESARAGLRRRLRTWQSLAAVLAIATTVSILTRPGSSAQLGTGTDGRLAEHIPPRNPAPPSPPQAPSPARYTDPESAFALRDAVLARGIDALPRSPVGHTAPEPIPSLHGFVWQ